MQDIYHQETNSRFMLSLNRALNSDVTLSANVGGNRRYSIDRDNYRGTNRLTVDRVYNISNSAVTPTTLESTAERGINTLFAQAQIGYRNYLFIGATGTNDWSSTLPKKNNSYFYPSVAANVIFTDAIPALRGNDVLSFGKIRAGWSRVGRDADPYLLTRVYPAGTSWGGTPAFTVPNTLSYADLKPEEKTSVELELRFLRDRFTVDFTVYDEKTVDLIWPAQLSTTSGYAAGIVNAGQMSNRGVELALSMVPVRMDNGFEWEVGVNYARNRNRIDELYGNLETLVLGTFWDLNIEARKGQPYGAMYGATFLRNEKGQIIVDEDGYPQFGPKDVLGKYDPDWTGGLSNTFRFRGLSLSALIDTKQGGNLFSVTNMFGAYAGILPETVEGRCGGPNLPACNTHGFIVPNSVDEDGNPNDKRVNPQFYWSDYLFQLHEPWIYDASFVKLREVRLGYNVPRSVTSRIGINGGMNVSLVGRNLAVWTKMPHIDPETSFDASNVQGIEFGQLPSARSFGFNISVTP